MPTLTIEFDDPNFGPAQETGIRVYRSTSAIDPENLPVPLADLPPDTTEYVDATAEVGQTYYYAISHYIGLTELVSQQMSKTVSGAANLYLGKVVMFLNMGQSNRVFRGQPADVVLDASDPDILQYLQGSDSIVVATQPLDNFDGEPDSVGDWLEFGKAFKAEHSPDKVLIVGLAEGGSGFLDGNWNPGYPGSTFVAAKARWAAAYAKAVSDYGIGNVVVGGIVWTEGEDEMQNFAAQFNIAGLGRYQHSVMPITMFDQIRSDWPGMSANTPVVVTSVPSGATLTGAGQAYTEVQAGLALIPSLLPFTGYVDNTDLATFDGVHWGPAEARTSGPRLNAGLTAAVANDFTVAYPTFTPDPANVETAFALDATGVPDGSALRCIAGTFPIFENKRAHISSGQIIFDGSTEIRWNEGEGIPYLEDRDFVLNMDITIAGSSEQGLISLYDTLGGNRSFALRWRSGNIEFYGSTGGSSGTTTQLLSQAAPAGTYNLVLRRSGDTALSMTLNSGTPVTTTLAAGYFIYTPDSDVRLHIGDHLNGRELVGSIARVSLEYLS